jgi:hypothetical protein
MLWLMCMSYTCIGVRSIAVLYLIGTSRMWLVEMRLIRGRMLSLAPR